MYKEKFYKEKFYKFIDNAKLLNKKFEIVPLLYGSLGLEVLTSSNLNSDDIDILIPEKYLSGNNWLNFKSFLESYNYELIDLHEHTFIKHNIKYSYAGIESLEDYTGIKICEIKYYNYFSTKYKLLSLEQYLTVYKESFKDGYRINNKEKQDFIKIKFIEKKLYGSDI